MSRCSRRWPGTLSLAVLGLVLWAGTASAIEPLLTKIKAVGKEGQGSSVAVQAVKELTGRGPEVLVHVLTGMKGANPVALNYLRAVVDTVAERTLSEKKALPAADLENFVKDAKQSGPARRLAYEWLLRVDATASDRLLPKMLDDPGAELRRDAVSVLLNDAQLLFDRATKDEKADRAPVIAAYRKVLQHARDRDQVQTIAGRLDKLGEKIDLTKHFGFLTEWQIVGPFENRKGVGYAAVYQPEKEANPSATYKDRDGKEIRWKAVTASALGQVDLNKEIDALHGAVAYARATVTSPVPQEVEFRAGSNNAVKIFLNGKEIFGREEYHHGMQMDQHVGRGKLQPGVNEILVKVCQNEQTEEWAQRWSFQLRVCDHLGAPVRLVPGGKTSVQEGGK